MRAPTRIALVCMTCAAMHATVPLATSDTLSAQTRETAGRVVLLPDAVFEGTGAGLQRVAFERLAADRSLRLVVFGHSHTATLARAPGGGVYANAGSWLDAPTYLRITPDRVELRRYDGSADGDRLDAIDAGAEEALSQP